MSTAEALAAAKCLLTEAHRSVGDDLAEVAQLLDSAVTALEHDRVEALRLLSAAADLEYDALGECEATGGLMQALGLEDDEEEPCLVV